jgi:hypothetical protein
MGRYSGLGVGCSGGIEPRGTPGTRGRHGGDVARSAVCGLAGNWRCLSLFWSQPYFDWKRAKAAASRPRSEGAPNVVTKSVMPGSFGVLVSVVGEPRLHSIELWAVWTYTGEVDMGFRRVGRRVMNLVVESLGALG